MAYLSMTIGDYRQFQLNVSKAGAPVDISNVAALTFTLQHTGGVELARWGLGTGVAVTNGPAGVAVLTVQPAMLAWASTWQTLRFTWGLVDFFGNPSQDIEDGVFQLIPPP